MTAVDLARTLPPIATGRALSQSIAVLDAVLSPDGYATYTFDRRWGPDQELASMSNGSGDEYSIAFTATGAFVRGFSHESTMSPYGDDDYRPWPGLVESVPAEFAEQVTEPAFSHEGHSGPFFTATVCLWRRHEDPCWQVGDIAFPAEEDPDGSAWLFDLLIDGTPEGYCAHASGNFEVSVDAADVRQVFEHRALTADLVRRINPDADLASLAEVLDTIGYPQAAASGGG
ncbi:hypothetical protein [Actinomadura violacea]|uniref:Uncharacterized protein n=1 Tax=Actinomadura violacea TaxID=2819934 RepID=A0ABS3RNL2_9ACTN|nr:hypothetical protein [Actinomadura violacea]MBO2458345.1 hypothetical protein [Actinomadura violacea]